MNSSIIPIVWRFLVLVGVQVLLLLQVSTFVSGGYFNVLLYPLFILLLPIQLPTPWVILLGALTGFIVDLFYGTLGMHASAGAFSGFVRAGILAGYKPKSEYTPKEPIPAPAYFGWSWFLQVAGFFYVAHLLWYFSVDAFAFVYFTSITLKTIASWILSMIFVVLYCVLFEPKN
jgi:hypothetical protein